MLQIGSRKLSPEGLRLWKVVVPLNSNSLTSEERFPRRWKTNKGFGGLAGVTFFVPFLSVQFLLCTVDFFLLIFQPVLVN